MYIPGNDALVITLAYRGVTFWFPLLLGGLAMRWLDTNPAEPQPQKT
jgi:hypothetical protein